MIDEKKNTKRNKIIITVAILLLAVVVWVFIFMNSTVTVNGNLSFHYSHNLNTGEPSGLIPSIITYIFYWWILGAIPAACVFLFMMCIYGILHRGDERLFKAASKHEEELEYGGKLAYIVTYVTIAIVMLLHISNIVTIDINF